MKRIIFEIFAFLAILVAIYFALGWGADKLANKVPDEWERKFFGSDEKVAEEAKQSAGNGKNAQIYRIFARLIQDKSLRHLNYQLVILADKDPNAFSYPGGTIAVTEGLKALVTGEIGLAMVLAHEIGHHFHRHALRQLGRGLVMAGFFGLMFGTDPGFVVGLIMKFAHSSYNHTQEFEADDFGLRLVQRTYGTTEGSLEFFEKVSKQGQGDADSRLTAILESHPYTPDRIKKLLDLSARISSPGNQRRKPGPEHHRRREK